MFTCVHLHRGTRRVKRRGWYLGMRYSVEPIPTNPRVLRVGLHGFNLDDGMFTSPPPILSRPGETTRVDLIPKTICPDVFQLFIVTGRGGFYFVWYRGLTPCPISLTGRRTVVYTHLEDILSKPLPITSPSTDFTVSLRVKNGSKFKRIH